MGAYLATHFRAAWRKVGTFTIRLTDAHPEGEREGGNVVAWFCTPDLRVIHAVGGAVTPEVFLEQAQWAVEMAGKLPMIPAEARASRIAKAHVEKAAEPPGTRVFL